MNAQDRQLHQPVRFVNQTEGNKCLPSWRIDSGCRIRLGRVGWQREGLALIFESSDRGTSQVRSNSRGQRVYRQALKLLKSTEPAHKSSKHSAVWPEHSKKEAGKGEAVGRVSQRDIVKAHFGTILLSFPTFRSSLIHRSRAVEGPCLLSFWCKG